MKDYECSIEFEYRIRANNKEDAREQFFKHYVRLGDVMVREVEI